MSKRRARKNKQLLDCFRCNGRGKIGEGFCNCGTGEGCTMHSDSALSIWGRKCEVCNGTGKVKHGAKTVQHESARPGKVGGSKENG